MKTYDLNKFIEKANRVHNNKFDYSLSIYVNAITPIKIICNKHGIFEQQPVSHMRGYGCPYCSGKNKTNKEFIEQSNIIHNYKYDYSLTEYIDAFIPINIICPIHGIFKQRPTTHLNGCGCQKCGGNKKLTNVEFIEKAIKIHGNKYDYSLCDYINSHTKIKIICTKHGVFEQRPNNHLNGANCSKCEKIIQSEKKILSASNNFIEKARKIHGDKYDYSLVEYINNRTKIKIICQEHGIFEQKVNSHLNNHGCPDCNVSKGELKIIEILNDKNINYIFQKSFDDCKNDNERKFKFDFYLPKQNILIEYDGKHHYEHNKYFGDIKSFELIKKYDSMKNDYAIINNITLIRIPYYNYKIIDKLLEFL